MSFFSLSATTWVMGINSIEKCYSKDTSDTKTIVKSSDRLQQHTKKWRKNDKNKKVDLFIARYHIIVCDSDQMRWQNVWCNVISAFSWGMCLCICEMLYWNGQNSQSPRLEATRRMRQYQNVRLFVPYFSERKWYHVKMLMWEWELVFDCAPKN